MKANIFHWKPLIGFLIICNLYSCIGDDFIEDFVEPELRITSTIGSLEVNTSFQMSFMYLNNVGLQETVDATWSSSDENIATINPDGLVSAVGAGNVVITASYDNGENLLTDVIEIEIIEIGEEPIVIELLEFSGMAQTTTFYPLKGSFTLAEQENNNLLLSFDDDYCTTAALPGLYIYLSNNRNSIAGAKEIDEVTVFSGAHEYEIEDAGINEYSFIVFFCKPFNIKIGDGEIIN